MVETLASCPDAEWASLCRNWINDRDNASLRETLLKQAAAAGKEGPKNLKMPKNKEDFPRLDLRSGEFRHGANLQGYQKPGTNHSAPLPGPEAYCAGHIFEWNFGPTFGMVPCSDSERS